MEKEVWFLLDSILVLKYEGVIKTPSSQSGKRSLPGFKYAEEIYQIVILFVRTNKM